MASILPRRERQGHGAGAVLRVRSGPSNLEGSAMRDESGPLALVIGGGSGIGAAVADASRALGTRTVTWDIAGAHDVTCDITEPDAIDDAVGVTRMRWGVPARITVTAGVGHAGLLTTPSLTCSTGSSASTRGARGSACAPGWVRCRSNGFRVPSWLSPASARGWSTGRWGSTPPRRRRSPCWSRPPRSNGETRASGSTRSRPG